MKKRVTIYVDEDVWKDIRKRALDEGISAGDYLVGFHESLVENTKAPKPEFCEHCQKAHWGACTSDDLRKKTESKILADAQKKLDETREKLERKKGESNAAWQIRKGVFERGAK